MNFAVSSPEASGHWKHGHCRAFLPGKLNEASSAREISRLRDEKILSMQKEARTDGRREASPYAALHLVCSVCVNEEVEMHVQRLRACKDSILVRQVPALRTTQPPLR